MSKPYDRKDHLYRKAKEEGYESRAAYKLMELDQRFGFLKRGRSVLDLGSWPGGWLQVAAERVGVEGLVVGVDLVALAEPVKPPVYFVQGDMRDEETLQKLRELSRGRFDSVVSDMSPKLTGIREADQAGTVALAELGLWVAGELLAEGGTFIAKVFKGNETEQFVRAARPRFTKIQRVELDSTRKTSNEFYVVGTGFKCT